MGSIEILNAPVVFADRFYLSPKALGAIALLGGYSVAEATDSRDLAEKIRGSSAVRVIVSEYVPLNDEVLEAAPALKGVIAYGAGYDHIDVAAMKRKGVMVCNCRGQNAQAVAELTFGLILCLLRRINRVDPWVRAGEWSQAGRNLPAWFSGRELWKKTLGVIGLGQIGSRVVRIAGGFEMQVLGYDPFMPPEQCRRIGVKPATLEELISLADLVTLHVPLTSETHKLINSRLLADAKPGMILVNTSRGMVVDEEALIKALQQGSIGGAALDVFAVEPLSSSHPLATMENVILSPHIGALSREAGERLSDAVYRQAKAILEERTPEYSV
jgi:D-3-phosphoglycerate dehydrogenase